MLLEFIGPHETPTNVPKVAGVNGRTAPLGGRLIFQGFSRA
jgi:hypothetical protein